jgi:hypothetical protein
MFAPARLLPALSLAAGLTAATASAHAQTDPRYFGQIRAELQAMGMPAQCAAASAQAGSCRVTAAGATGNPNVAPGRRFVMGLDYSDVTDTVYVYIDHYTTLRGDAPNAAATFRRLMEINWEMLVGRFEWSAQTGELRLSATLNTDSNFDRRAFRGVVRALLRLAERYAEEVARVSGSPVGESLAAPTGAPGASVPPAGAAPGGATLRALPAPTGAAAPGTR